LDNGVIPAKHFSKYPKFDCIGKMLHAVNYFDFRTNWLTTIPAFCAYVPHHDFHNIEP
jgi:hypothetical protein